MKNSKHFYINMVAIFTDHRSSPNNGTRLTVSTATSLTDKETYFDLFVMPLIQV